MCSRAIRIAPHPRENDLCVRDQSYVFMFRSITTADRYLQVQDWCSDFDLALTEAEIEGRVRRIS